MGFVLLGLIIAAIPFVLPIAGWVSARRTRSRVTTLESVVLAQADQIERLLARVREVEQAARERTAATEAAPPTPPAAEPAAPAAAAEALEPLEPLPPIRPLEPLPPIRPLEPLEPLAQATPEAPLEPLSPLEPMLPEAAAPLASTTEESLPVEEVGTPSAEGVSIPPDMAAPPPPPPPSPAPAAAAAFDWESLIGVKLFAGIAGVALVLAAVFFLRYSIDQGWLQPPVRVAIGVIVAVALLVLCELKSAREYPATANALDGAAIAILFATFYAAHALWDLIPASATFVLLAVVTALAVLLSIRRESLFIAVLGLLGGFATPALLSTGENRPIPLFAYLLLLNVGLAWVAYRQVWPVLTWLTLAFTTLYQWGWVARFLDESSLSIAMGMFLVFPLAAGIGLLLTGPRMTEPGRSRSASNGRRCSRPACLCSSPRISRPCRPTARTRACSSDSSCSSMPGCWRSRIARRQWLLHAVGGLATLVVLAVWLATSYVPVSRAGRGARTSRSGSSCSIAGAPVDWRVGFGRPLRGRGRAAAADRAAAGSCSRCWPRSSRRSCGRCRCSPRCSLALVAHSPGGRSWSRPGPLYYVASFFAIAAQAVWSARHLTEERLRIAVLHLRHLRCRLDGDAGDRATRRPAAAAAWGSGAVLLASLCLLAFVSLGPGRLRGAVGAGAAAGDHERRALRGERVRRPAADLAGRVAAVVGAARPVVAATLRAASACCRRSP